MTVEQDPPVPAQSSNPKPLSREKKLFYEAAAHHKARRFKEAVDLYAALLKQKNPEISKSVRAGIQYNLGLIGEALKNATAAHDHFERSALLYEDLCKTLQHSDIANLFFAEALEHCHEPQLARYYLLPLIKKQLQDINLLHAYAFNCANLGFFEEALHFFKKALDKNPQNFTYRTNFGMLSLMLGDLQTGWEYYEDRYQMPDYVRALDKPLWQGEKISGKRLLILAEQGAGDSIQFIRYLSQPIFKDIFIIIECHESLYRLFKNQAHLKCDHIFCLDAPLPEHDYAVHLLSLPKILQTKLESIPNDTPYLQINDQKITEKWKKSLLPYKNKKVGIAYSGTKLHARDKERSCPLKHWLPILKLPGYDFFSLQKENDTAQINALPPDIKINCIDTALTDFLETAAYIQNLDLIITVDTSVAHLAAALNKPTWILLPLCPDWRWLTKRTDSPWYPAVRLFRQNHYDDWDEPIRAVQQALSLYTHRSFALY